METNGYAMQKGIPNGSNGTSSSNGTRRKRAKVLTVDEALPYSPFSSVVPFNSGSFDTMTPLSMLNLLPSDIIPLPSIGLRSSTSIFPTPAHRDAARQGLESLNREAQDPSNTSGRLQKSLHELKELLTPEGVTKL